MPDTAPNDRRERALRWLAPAAVLALGVVIWDLIVRLNGLPPYILPGPGLVLSTLLSDWAILWSSLLATLETTVEGLALAVIGGVSLAVLFNQSRLIEHSLYPYAVILQVTPVVAIAPLLLIYLPQQAAVLACAWIVAFFPVLANTTLGLNSVDHNLADLFRVKGIGEEYSDLLEEAGVDTVPELAQRNPANLYETLVAINQQKKLVRKLPTQGQVGSWVDQAKALPRLVSY